MKIPGLIRCKTLLSTRFLFRLSLVDLILN